MARKFKFEQDGGRGSSGRVGTLVAIGWGVGHPSLLADALVAIAIGHQGKSASGQGLGVGTHLYWLGRWWPSLLAGTLMVIGCWVRRVLWVLANSDSLNDDSSGF